MRDFFRVLLGRPMPEPPEANERFRATLEREAASIRLEQAINRREELNRLIGDMVPKRGQTE